MSEHISDNKANGNEDNPWESFADGVTEAGGGFIGHCGGSIAPFDPSRSNIDFPNDDEHSAIPTITPGSIDTHTHLESEGGNEINHASPEAAVHYELQQIAEEFNRLKQEHVDYERRMSSAIREVINTLDRSLTIIQPLVEKAKLSKRKYSHFVENGETTADREAAKSLMQMVDKVLQKEEDIKRLRQEFAAELERIAAINTRIDKIDKRLALLRNQ